jgi:23S rRNA (guanosine2251-2'-O)-methyltransferase
LGEEVFVTAEIDGNDFEIVYGVHAVQARLQTTGGRITKLLLAAATSSGRIAKILRQAERQHVTIESVSGQQLDQLTDGVHQGVALLCKHQTVAGEDTLEELLRDGGQQKLLLVLDGVTDPHNLGACLRSSAALGVDAVIVPKDRSVGLTPAAIKAASGAADLVPFMQVANLARCLTWLKQWGVWVIGLAVEGSQSITDIDLTGSVALVMGSENKGLRRLTRQKCDALAHIPMSGTASADSPDGSLDSLNVSVAAGICLYEVIRQRSLSGVTGTD